MKKLNIYIFALLGILGCTLAACDDDDVTVAKAVLASAPSLTFEGVSAQPQSILVYADADWYSEAPDYVTISPATGHGGTTEVTISMADNLRDGALDNPRQIDVLFRGTTKKSIATVTLFQLGDNYRGIADYSIFEMASTPDKTAMVMPGITVVDNFVKGQLVTDGTDFAYATGFPEGMVPGAVGTLQGHKASDEAGYPYVEGEFFIASGTAEVAHGEPADITAALDSYSPDAMKFVSVTGHVDGNTLYVDGQTSNVIAADAVEGVVFSDLANHNVKVCGYFAGKAGKTLRLLATSIEDLGMYQVVYWSEDWEWLEPWSVASGAGDHVGTDDMGASAPALTSVKTMVDGKEISCFEYIESRGYKFVYDKNDNKRTYLQRNYLKFGKTGNHSGIILPSITTVPEGENVVITFDWAVMRQGSGKIDPVTLYVEVQNGDDVKRFDIPPTGWEDGHKLEWIKATADLSGIKIDKDTKITISQNEWEVGTANRWMLDNIKILPKE